ncbi:sugar ABC transporter permease [bacterium]|nr:MAG: sugar ABC transporter permease [bacterium]
MPTGSRRSTPQASSTETRILVTTKRLRLRRLRAGGKWSGGRLFALLTATPATVLLVALSVFPLLYSLWLSLTDSSLLSTQAPRFTGVANYVTILGDHLFWTSLGVTAVFALSVVTVQLAVGIGLAMALHRLKRAQQVLATVLLMPSILSPSVASFQWRQLFNYNSGVLNYALQKLGLPLQGWTADPHLALPSLVVVDFWEWTPFMMLLLFAGLQSIPPQVFEAARVDGSTGWQIFRFQILPLLRRVIAIAVILRLIAAFKVFDVIYVLTQGGPGSITESLAYYTYVQGFRYFTVGYSAALSFVSLVLVLVLAKLILGYMERPAVRTSFRAAR